MNLDTIGENIRAFRKQNGLTQEELAGRLGVTYQAVSKWEHGTTAPDISLLPGLAAVFGTSIDALMGYAAEGVGLLLESPVFGLTFDTGHDAAQGFRQFPLIERNIERLRHMHLHDFSSERGDHLPLGEGTLDIGRYLKLADKHNCRVLLETKTPEGVRRSAQYIREITSK
ncbi:MAG: helix-turn-helix domain-containing protein [Oscillospiraceae bacterium]|nr:helix-turn-helix domain-containing protein [Oscillospiraceae bacterium]